MTTNNNQNLFHFFIKELCCCKVRINWVTSQVLISVVQFLLVICWCFTSIPYYVWVPLLIVLEVIKLYLSWIINFTIKQLTVQFHQFQKLQFTTKCSDFIDTIHEYLRWPIFSNHFHGSCRRHFAKDNYRLLNSIAGFYRSLIKYVERLQLVITGHDEFVRYIFHEIRIPMNNMQLAISQITTEDCYKTVNRRYMRSLNLPDDTSQLLQQYVTNIDEYSRIIDHQCQIMCRVVNDVLTVKQMEYSKLKLEVNPFSLDSLIQRARSDANFNALAKHIRISIENPEAQDLQVLGDKHRLQQVLNNLISNAIKFSPEFSTIEISLQCKEIPLEELPRERSITPPLIVMQESYDTPPQSSLFQPILNPQQIRTAWIGLAHTAAHVGHKVSEESAPISIPSNILREAEANAQTLHIPPNNASSMETLATYRIKICVRDFGVGVSKEDQQKLFQPFMQILPGKQQKGKGTGLGLNIAKMIIQAHHGNILHRKPSDGRPGSEFVIMLYLPAMRISKTEPRKISPLSVRRQLPYIADIVNNASSNDSNSNPPSDDSDSHIINIIEDAKADHPVSNRLLLVEDDVITNKMMKKRLESQGFIVDSLFNGQECVDLVKKSTSPKYQCIIIDGEMPIKNGYEASRELRKILGINTPIIAVTGNALKEDVDKFLCAGANKVFVKPCNILLITEYIRKLASIEA